MVSCTENVFLFFFVFSTLVCMYLACMYACVCRSCSLYDLIFFFDTPRILNYASVSNHRVCNHHVQCTISCGCVVCLVYVVSWSVYIYASLCDGCLAGICLILHSSLLFFWHVCMMYCVQMCRSCPLRFWLLLISGSVCSLLVRLRHPTIQFIDCIQSHRFASCGMYIMWCLKYIVRLCHIRRIHVFSMNTHHACLPAFMLTRPYLCIRFEPPEVPREEWRDTMDTLSEVSCQVRYPVDW